MPQLSDEQRVFVAKTYYETKKYTDVINSFRQRFPGQNVPNKTTIWRNVNKYETHATSLNRNPKNSGRRKTGRSNKNIDAVQVQVALEQLSVLILWGYIKCQVYRTPPNDINDLRNRIIREADRVKTET